MTVFLRIADDELDFAGDGRIQAQLEVYPTYDVTEVTVNGRSLPLETDLTAAIAYSLENPDVWKLDLRRFLFLKDRIKPHIVMATPYERGKIPVVFVHGTASELVWWMEMFNTLRGDTRLNREYQFWFFRYNSDHPLVDSAAALRSSLREKIQELAATGQDQALDNVVVIGHSQGGLLTKMAVVDSGDRLWRALSDEPFEQIDIDPEGRQMLASYLFLKPLPFVRRVVYIATPHRGSFLAKPWISSLFRSILSLPTTIIQGSAAYLTLQKRLKLPVSLDGKLPTSIDGMSPKNPMLLELAEIPAVPEVKAHSIIAVKDIDNFQESDDGVVEYQSAHLAGVASEYLVPSSHSCQDNPLAIEEVRRILLEHLAEVNRKP